MFCSIVLCFGGPLPFHEDHNIKTEYCYFHANDDTHVRTNRTDSIQSWWHPTYQCSGLFSISQWLNKVQKHNTKKTVQNIVKLFESVTFKAQQCYNRYCDVAVLLPRVNTAQCKNGSWRVRNFSEAWKSHSTKRRMIAIFLKNCGILKKILLEKQGTSDGFVNRITLWENLLVCLFKPWSITKTCPFQIFH